MASHVPTYSASLLIEIEADVLKLDWTFLGPTQDKAINYFYE